ncbi:hypothetical protein BSKO_01691 [Bryopsis sp. KO-2023]|nr:hypothetical protein BSKO_01691 [Bryopsis sp. KO-2023]
MAPFGLFEPPLQRTPLSAAVPLDGTEHQMGLRQLERLNRQTPGVRTRYRRYKGPFIEYLTVEDLKKEAREWNDFLHCSKSALDCYTVPGSVDALVERLEENIVYYLPNYLQVIAAITFLMLGPFHGLLASALLASYAYFKDNDLVPPRHEQLRQVLGVALPFLAVWLAVLTPIASILSRGIFFGLCLVFSHGSLHRSPSEFRYRQQNGVVRWVKRGRAAPEGVVPLLHDLKVKFRNACVDWKGWLRWRVFELREFFIKKRWILSEALKSGWRRKRRTGLTSVS